MKYIIVKWAMTDGWAFEAYAPGNLGGCSLEHGGTDWYALGTDSDPGSRATGRQTAERVIRANCPEACGGEMVGARLLVRDPARAGEWRQVQALRQAYIEAEARFRAAGEEREVEYGEESDG